MHVSNNYSRSSGPTNHYGPYTRTEYPLRCFYALPVVSGPRCYVCAMSSFRDAHNEYHVVRYHFVILIGSAQTLYGAFVTIGRSANRMVLAQRFEHWPRDPPY